MVLFSREIKCPSSFKTSAVKSILGREQLCRVPGAASGGVWVRRFLTLLGEGAFWGFLSDRPPCTSRCIIHCSSKFRKMILVIPSGFVY